MVDPPLTAQGEAQAQLMSGVTAMMPTPDLVVVSPLTRALQTGQRGFRAALESGTPFVALDAARETVCHPCDARRPVPELQSEYDVISFSELQDEDDAMWRRYESSREVDDLPAMHARCTTLMEWILARPVRCRRPLRGMWARA